MSTNTSTAVSWHERAKSLSLRTQAFINGRYVDAVSGATFERINPANGQPLAAVAAGDTRDIDAAVAAARKAFDSGVWAKQPPSARKKVLQKFAELILQ